MHPSESYDYIIAGAGCAGLSLAMNMIRSGGFGDKKILLIDQDLKTANDRTWCFWQAGEGMFEPVVHHRWDHLWFHGERFSSELSIQPYQYKMIRGIDFYDYCFREIRQQTNFTIRTGRIDHLFSSDTTTGIMVNGTAFHAEYVFNSILFQKPELSAGQHWLWQHFKGWFIETEEDCFNPAVATLMDFRVPQEAGTTFCYVLPFSSRRALVEYTVFSPELLLPEQYEEGLNMYVERVLGIRRYSVSGKEFGKIPMTNFSFSPRQNNIINIGTAGGQTKGSSGYTFQFIQKNCRYLVEQMRTKKRPSLPSAQLRFQFYDSILLNILSTNSLPGKTIFTDLFRKNPPQRVLKFLDNESSIREDLGIISSLPSLPFIKAAWRQLG